MRIPLLASALLLAACGEPPPPPPVLVIGPTPDTLVVPAVNVSHAAPLSGGRWAVLGLEEGVVHLADFTAHTVTPFPGMTRAEVSKPSVLFGVGDTIVVGDWGLSRVTRWTPGQPRLEAIPMPAALGGALPRATDAAGHWYFQLAARAADSAAIVRGDAMLTRFDTLAKLAPHDLASVADGYGSATVARALGGEDRWGVLSDGTLWVARNFQNRVTWYSADGKEPVRGKALPDPVLTVSEMDKEIYIRRYPEDQRENARMSTQWAAIKPPFERAFAGPDGNMWLFKSAPALDSVRAFQISNPEGVVRTVTVPSRGMPLSVTRDAILMAEEFPGGIRLLRYALPKEAVQP